MLGLSRAACVCPLHLVQFAALVVPLGSIVGLRVPLRTRVLKSRERR